MTRRKHMEANSTDDRSGHRLDVVPAPLDGGCLTLFALAPIPILTERFRPRGRRHKFHEVGGKVSNFEQTGLSRATRMRFIPNPRRFKPQEN